MSDLRPRVRLPRSASAGSSVQVRTLINHEMETGTRRDASGAPVPRHMINRFTCDYNGVRVIEVELDSGISANPYLEFEAIVPESGEFVFTWHEDGGAVHTHTQAFEVS